MDGFTGAEGILIVLLPLGLGRLTGVRARGYGHPYLVTRQWLKVFSPLAISHDSSRYLLGEGGKQHGEEGVCVLLRGGEDTQGFQTIWNG